MRVFSSDDPFGHIPDNVTNANQDRLQPPENPGVSTAWLQNVKDSDGRFFRIRDRGGNSVGLGFFCQRCHLEVRYGIPLGGRVWHCGSYEAAPDRIERLHEQHL